MDNQDKTTTTTPPKKGSSFKRSLIWLLVLGLIGGSGYVAYNQGALDGYLPNMLKAHAETTPEETPKTATPAAPVGADTANPANSAPASAPAATPADLQAALAQQLQQQNGNTATNNATSTPNAVPTNATGSGSAPIVLAINGAPANALLTAYDAQWQWSTIQQDFTQRADATLALQNVQNLKAQLQAANDPAFAPALTALAQTETQLQAWTSVPSAKYLADLQQALVAVDGLGVRTKEETTAVDPATLSWWERVVASMKNVVEIKKIDGAKEAQMLSPATAALVKQGIGARLLSAQWSAQTGQWSMAQSNAAAAQRMAVQWSDAAAFTPLQAFLDVKSFPATPDFAAVATALQQARMQLTSAARAQQSAPAAPAATMPNPTPSAPAATTAPTTAKKEGA